MSIVAGDMYAVGASSNSADMVVSMVEPHSNSIVAAWQIHNITVTIFTLWVDSVAQFLQLYIILLYCSYCAFILIVTDMV